jgi:hypothetical protein
VLSACLASPDCHAAYVERLRELSELFESLDLASAARAELELIEAAGRADQRKPADDEYAAHARSLLLQYIAERPAALRAELPAVQR